MVGLVFSGGFSRRPSIGIRLVEVVAMAKVSWPDGVAGFVHVADGGGARAVSAL